MVASIKRFVAVLMLVVLAGNGYVWDSSSVRMAHQISHLGHLDQGAANHTHATLARAGGPAQSGALHQVLHAVDHLQYFAEEPVHASVPAADAGSVLIGFSDQAPALRALDPPFRPPSV
jgi:hypothetical protein